MNEANSPVPSHQQFQLVHLIVECANIKIPSNGVHNPPLQRCKNTPARFPLLRLLTLLAKKWTKSAAHSKKNKTVRVVVLMSRSYSWV